MVNRGLVPQIAHAHYCVRGRFGIGIGEIKSHEYFRMQNLKVRLARGGAAMVGLWLALPAIGAESISYNRDIRPILSDTCFHCHGPDQKTRKGKFRLDVAEDAVKKGAIVPGKPEESKLITRILSKEADEVMPPPESHKPLSVAQKDVLSRWIAAGAKYEKHWAYVPPVKPPTPAEGNPIDALVHQRQRELGLTAAPPADRRTLARRMYFDLAGLPPKPEEVDAFSADPAPEAVARLSEKLLAAPQFGERMAIGWLDVVRYADTIGYHSDNPRNVWPYRDYVIRAFNDNKRFDQFTREQLAGDLLPGATQQQKVGSAFNRLILSTEEGGAQAKDYEARMLTDRERAVSSVWLCQTVGCAQCHDHKFDPIKQRDFYSLGAFFADIEEPIIGGREPGMLVPDATQAAELQRHEEVLARAQKEYDTPKEEWLTAYGTWEAEQTDGARQESRWTALSPATAVAASGAELKVEKDHSVLARGKTNATEIYTIQFTNGVKNAVAFRLETMPHDSLPGKGPGRGASGNFALTEVVATVQRPGQTPSTVQFLTARADFEQLAVPAAQSRPRSGARAVIGGPVKVEPTGWAIAPQTGQPHQLILSLSAPLTVHEGETLVLELKQNEPGLALGRFRIGVATDPAETSGPLRFAPVKEIADLLLIPVAKRDAAQRDKLFAYFKNGAPETAAARKTLAEARKSRDELVGTVPRCLVSATNFQPRTVRVLPRGNFLIETGDIVQPALPQFLAGEETTAPGRRLNRLDLANWLVARENPLPARVVMNRLWKQFFGVGLSRVVDDLGAQGELPPNQALLDWLACEFMDSGWDVKHMVRLIVNSEVYQQSSVPSPETRAHDPLNRELAAQGRWRLEAELVRDNALTVAGLLEGRIGGPSTKPYQPEGYWENLNFPTRNYDASTGKDQYRRGLYTWWQRSYLHPSLVAFDAPTREECAADRNRSNIPQQALVLLNDPTYVEAARALAVRMIKEGGEDAGGRIAWAWRQVLNRAPRADELATTRALLAKELAEYHADPAAAQNLLKTGQTPLPGGLDNAELAAWTNIARVLLNLHETITRA